MPFPFPTLLAEIESRAGSSLAWSLDAEIELALRQESIPHFL